MLVKAASICFKAESFLGSDLTEPKTAFVACSVGFNSVFFIVFAFCYTKITT